MGNYFTSVFPSGRYKEQVPESEDTNALPKPETGSKTPVMSKTDADAFDPRSPSHNVSRTPLKTEEKKNDILCDPRSPLQEVNRTPIAVNEKGSKASDRDQLRRKALGNSKMPMPSFDDCEQTDTLENNFTSTQTAEIH